MERLAATGTSNPQLYQNKTGLPSVDEMKEEYQLAGKATFLDAASFTYKREVIQYCNGSIHPRNDVFQFLTVLEAVLTFTDTTIHEVTQQQHDQFKEAVRRRFLDLYKVNERNLFFNAPSSTVHEMVQKVMAAT